MTDEEVLTIYLFGLFKKRETVSDIHEYAKDHFSDWFPDLPTQKSYNRRPGRLSAVFSPPVEKALQKIDGKRAGKTILRIADSMPIMISKGPRASQARVGFEQIADVGYCSSKNTFYHGAKLHVVAERRNDQLPVPKRIGLTSASENDLKALRRVLPTIEDGILCGDKAYCDGPLKERLVEDQNLELLTSTREK
nr:transposase [Salinibacter ruber]